MKILKKIGLFCLTLVICLFSCFKFVNAKEIVPSNMMYADTTYYLYIRTTEDFDIQPIFYINYQNYTCEVDLDLTYGVLYIISPYTEFEWFIYYLDTIDIGDWSYSVYEFECTIDCQFIDYEFTPDLLYIDTVYISHGGIYNSINNLVIDYIFGGHVEPNSSQELTATIVSVFASILLFALPFLIVWKVIKTIMG